LFTINAFGDHCKKRGRQKRGRVVPTAIIAKS